MSIRLDAFTIVYPKYISPGVYEATGSTYRGFMSESSARAYAKQVFDFFLQNALTQPVFVVRGPTSTTTCNFEVVDATAGYTVVLRLG